MLLKKLQAVVYRATENEVDEKFRVKLKLIFLELLNDTFQLHRTGVGICKGNTLELNLGSTWFVSRAKQR
jgi:hypothetical protein